jgi:hypothetical protein
MSALRSTDVKCQGSNCEQAQGGRFNEDTAQSFSILDYWLDFVAAATRSRDLILICL